MNRGEIYDELTQLVRVIRKLQHCSEYESMTNHKSVECHRYTVGRAEAYKVCANLLEDTVKKIAKQ